MQSREWTARVRSFLADVSEYLEGVTTIEERVALTLGLVVSTVLLAQFLLPRVADLLDRSLRDRFVSGRIADGIEQFGHYAPTTLGGLVLRTIQLTLLVSTVVAALILWGFSDAVVWAGSLITERITLIGRLLSSIGVLILAYVGAGVIADMVEDFSTHTEWMTDHQEEIVLRMSQLGLFLFMGLLLMTVWDVTLEGFLVGAGFLGIVVGFAARQTLGSLIAGFVLMFSRPFTIGDWVQVGDEEGIVTDITIFNTRLENFDGEFVVIPNDQVSNQAITNRSQKGLLRIRVDVGVDYATDPDHAKQVALETISQLKEVVDAPPPQVFPKAFGDSAVVMEMRFWIDHPTPPRKWKAISAVITAVKAEFAAEDITIPFPQRELSGRAETGGFRVHETDAETSADVVGSPERE